MTISRVRTAPMTAPFTPIANVVWVSLIRGRKKPLCKVVDGSGTVLVSDFIEPWHLELTVRRHRFILGRGVEKRASVALRTKPSVSFSSLDKLLFQNFVNPFLPWQIGGPKSKIPGRYFVQADRTCQHPPVWFIDDEKRRTRCLADLESTRSDGRYDRASS